MSNFSRLRLTTLLVGVFTTALIGFAVIAEAATNIELLSENISRGLWFIAALAWFGNIAAVCRDTMLRQLHQRLDRLAASIGDYGDQRETDGRLAGMRDTAEAINQRRPHLVQ
ncbi:hypothetical protein ACFFX1_54595 [Dactylosporangium sucinum]|uniref:Uncharacterized protein n=1 Tax=Dactylosporangium sucinum TaxID=1424081 RepID=A0A917UJK3_9ACTN|nr:hypothetical protein [Dactylosporangium sucinum]GGM90714.1 hypothetical protein GCM10007977_110900 [Dactylosporangium sucinum]